MPHLELKYSNVAGSGGNPDVQLEEWQTRNLLHEIWRCFTSRFELWECALARE